MEKVISINKNIILKEKKNDRNVKTESSESN